MNVVDFKNGKLYHIAYHSARIDLVGIGIDSPSMMTRTAGNGHGSGIQLMRAGVVRLFGKA